MSPEDIARLLASAKGRVTLAKHLLRFVHKAVAHHIDKNRGAHGSSSRQDLCDVVNEIFEILFKNDGKILRAWDQQRGRKFESYIVMVTKKRLISMDRSPRRRNPRARADLPLDDSMVPPADDPERWLVEAERFERILQRIHQDLNERGRLLFFLIYVEGLSIDEVCTRTGMTPGAVRTWRGRFKKIFEKILRSLDCEDDGEGNDDDD